MFSEVMELVSIYLDIYLPSPTEDMTPNEYDRRFISIWAGNMLMDELLDAEVSAYNQELLYGYIIYPIDIIHNFIAEMHLFALESNTPAMKKVFIISERTGNDILHFVKSRKDTL